METFLMVSGVLLLGVFSGYRILLPEKKYQSSHPYDNYSHAQNSLISAAAINQFLGLAFILTGLGFQTGIIQHPAGVAGLLLDGMFLLIPVSAFVFCLGNRPKAE